MCCTLQVGCLLFHAVEDKVRHDHEGFLVRRRCNGIGEADGFIAVFLGEETRLFEALRFVDELEGFLDVAGFLEPPHDHGVQDRVLEIDSS